MGEVIIDVKNLIKTYKIYEKSVDRLKETLSISKKIYSTEFNALNNISFQVEEGDAVGILGKNGSGKSTLLKIITGVLNQTSGEIVTRGRISSILELGTGFNPEYTGLENIYLNNSIMGYTKEETDERVEEIISFADIGAFVKQPVKIYSSGMFARLAFSVAINVEPDILIIDEALAVGDTRFQIKCIDKLKELKKSGTTILFVSHATEQVKRFCNKAIWLKNGEIEASGNSSEIVDLYENYMRFGDACLYKKEKLHDEKKEEPFVMPSNSDIVASITKININKSEFNTFDELSVDITYEIYEERIEGFLLGVAIYSADRKGYIFGPNTYLDKKVVPHNKGRHRVIYTIPRLTIINGSYMIDVGLFNNEGIVMLDYKEGAELFSVSNSYFSEGQFYIDHEWTVIK